MALYERLDWQLIGQRPQVGQHHQLTDRSSASIG